LIGFISAPDGADGSSNLLLATKPPIRGFVIWSIVARDFGLIGFISAPDGADGSSNKKNDTLCSILFMFYTPQLGIRFTLDIPLISFKDSKVIRLMVKDGLLNLGLGLLFIVSIFLQRKRLLIEKRILSSIGKD
jgi:hypothetical protein